MSSGYVNTYTGDITIGGIAQASIPSPINTGYCTLLANNPIPYNYTFGTLGNDSIVQNQLSPTSIFYKPTLYLYAIYEVEYKIEPQDSFIKELLYVFQGAAPVNALLDKEALLTLARLLDRSNIKYLAIKSCTYKDTASLENPVLDGAILKCQEHQRL